MKRAPNANPPSKRILILTSAGKFPGFAITWLAQAWRETGYDVVFSDHANTGIKADIAVVHVDTTDVPPEYLARARACLGAVNASCVSIRKDLFSTATIPADCDYEGTVIVKTIANYGGLHDFQRAEMSMASRARAQLSRRIALSEKPIPTTIRSFAWRYLQTLDSSDYPRFFSTKDVPKGAWKNDHLVVEKFMPERISDGRYVLRHWYFLGNREFSRTLVCKNPVPKWASMDDDERAQSRAEWFSIDASVQADIPDEIRRVRAALKMDFGRIDWAIHKGEPVAFDANKTPAGLGSISLDSKLDRRRYEVMQQLSEGVAGFL